MPSQYSKSSFFVQKFNFDFLRKIVKLFWVKAKTRENATGFDFLAFDNFDFTRKIVKKIWVKNSWKCWGFLKIEFLDNLTFRTVCFWRIFVRIFRIQFLWLFFSVKTSWNLFDYFILTNFVFSRENYKRGKSSKSSFVHKAIKIESFQKPVFAHDFVL